MLLNIKQESYWIIQITFKTKITNQKWPEILWKIKLKGTFMLVLGFLETA